MKWYKKILFWEIHRIPLNIIAISMLLLSIEVFSPDPFKTGEQGDHLMFYTHLLVIFLVLFNLLFFFTWIISLFMHITNFKKSIFILIGVYFICMTLFFTLPVLYSV